MKPESAKRIVDAYFDVFDELSIKTFNQGLSLVLEGLEDRLNSLRPIRTREGFLAKLLKEPEPEPFELEAQVEAIHLLHLLPYTIRKVMPQTIRDVARVFPQDPGGRPHSLNEKELRYVCEEIGKLFAQGVRLRDAQDRLARRMSQKKGKDVSIRTVQRAWQDRSNWFGADAQKPTNLGERIVNKLRGQADDV